MCDEFYGFRWLVSQLPDHVNILEHLLCMKFIGTI